MTELHPASDLTPPLLPDREELLRVQRRRLRHAASRVRVEAAADVCALGVDAIPLLRDALNDSHPEVRIAGIGSLQRIGTPQAVDGLSAGLNDEQLAVRLSAANALTTPGLGPAVDALCEALKHRDRSTLTAAAQALGAVGDPRAVPHLLEAHRRCFLGRSARGQLVLGLLVAAAFVLLLAAFLWGSIAAKAGGAFGCINIFLRGAAVYFNKRKEQSLVAAAISDALLRIAESSSAPEIHRIVPELRSVTRDRLQHTRETRAAAREAADRIEALTARLQQLPVASGTTEAPADDLLPRPASAPAAPARLIQ